MSKSDVKGYMYHASEPGWRFECDAAGCDCGITVFANGHVIDDAIHDSQLIWHFNDAKDAFAAGAVYYGWRRTIDAKMHVRHYCPKHGREEVQP